MRRRRASAAPPATEAEDRDPDHARPAGHVRRHRERRRAASRRRAERRDAQGRGCGPAAAAAMVVVFGSSVVRAESADVRDSALPAPSVNDTTTW